LIGKAKKLFSFQIIRDIEDFVSNLNRYLPDFKILEPEFYHLLLFSHFLFAPCPLRHALCAMRYALCAMPFAPCPLRHALCAMPFAPCAMRYAFCFS
jgi:hypothetical protein